MINKPNILPSTRTGLALYYNVRLEIFNDWININQELQEILKPYLKKRKRVLPPNVVKRIIEILGEP